MAVDAVTADPRVTAEGPTVVEPSDENASAEPSDSAAEYDVLDPSTASVSGTGVSVTRDRWRLVLVGTPGRATITAGLLVCVMLMGLVASLSYQAYRTHQTQDQRQRFLEVGRQGAVDLTSIDYRHAPEDVARILNTSSGEIHQNFEQRAQPFIKVVQQVKAATKATISEAGLETVEENEAQVLVALRVERWINDAPQEPNYFRMRINVKLVDGSMKMTNVEFVT